MRRSIGGNNSGPKMLKTAKASRKVNTATPIKFYGRDRRLGLQTP